MAVLDQIITGLERGRQEFVSVMDKINREDQNGARGSRSLLALGDNEAFMGRLLSEGYGSSFRMIYIDPPFFTKSKFNASVSIRDAGGSRHRIRHLAFDDRFERSLEYYVENMTVRILMMRELLADDGTLWIHLDWHS